MAGIKPPLAEPRALRKGTVAFPNSLVLACHRAVPFPRTQETTWIPRLRHGIRGNQAIRPSGSAGAGFTVADQTRSMLPQQASADTRRFTRT
eukprot:CAMPEP_0202073042 /NCGR_PEP_ID=MMETSP0964-20121228/2807_1 /ASSEMBLY_ACC=CAM_ASM_000500 /TAXON_ID=4773 /ORGANISM="Schizochytrium aggregatum, Strain ATCC28209" /LENGTH=91 /DNA_ID=CAMNT_0048640123 /DNA_START=95 /DNA_END=367 /DNA_ORIENTATION=+